MEEQLYSLCIERSPQPKRNPKFPSIRNLVNCRLPDPLFLEEKRPFWFTPCFFSAETLLLHCHRINWATGDKTSQIKATVTNLLIAASLELMVGQLFLSLLVARVSNTVVNNSPFCSSGWSPLQPPPQVWHAGERDGTPHSHTADSSAPVRVPHRDLSVSLRLWILR